jgi:hypothetical protein
MPRGDPGCVRDAGGLVMSSPSGRREVMFTIVEDNMTLECQEEFTEVVNEVVNEVEFKSPYYSDNTTTVIFNNKRGWVIIDCQYSVERFWVAHLCASTKNPEFHTWRHSSWSQMKNKGCFCYCCHDPLPEDIQTLYTFLSIEK